MPEVRPTLQLISYCTGVIPFCTRIYFELSSVWLSPSPLVLVLLSESQRISQAPWRKFCVTQKPLEKISNFHHHATTSIHPVALIHKVHCQFPGTLTGNKLYVTFFFLNVCCHSKRHLSYVQKQVAEVSSSHLPTCPGSICHRGNGIAQVWWELSL